MGAQGCTLVLFLFQRFIGVGVCLYAHACVCLPTHVCECLVQLDDCKVQKKASAPRELQAIMSLQVGAENFTQVLFKSSKYC